MNLDIPYPIMSFLRELVKDKQKRLWQSNWAPFIRRKPADFPKVYRHVMERKNLLTEEGCCAIAQEAFAKAEEEVQIALGMRR